MPRRNNTFMGIFATLTSYITGFFQSVARISASDPNTNALTNVYSAPTFVEHLGSIDFTLTGGSKMTVGCDGVFFFDLERVFENNATNPPNPVEVFMKMTLNKGLGGEVSIVRSAIIGAATAADEPSVSSYTSARHMALVAGDTLDVEFKAEDSVTGLTVAGVNLIHAQACAHQIGSLVP